MTQKLKSLYKSYSSRVFSKNFVNFIMFSRWNCISNKNSSSPTSPPQLNIPHKIVTIHFLCHLEIHYIFLFRYSNWVYSSDCSIRIEVKWNSNIIIYCTCRQFSIGPFISRISCKLHSRFATIYGHIAKMCEYQHKWNIIGNEQSDTFYERSNAKHLLNVQFCHELVTERTRTPNTLNLVHY